MTDKWKKVDGGTWEKWEKVNDDPSALAMIGGAFIWIIIITAMMKGCS